MSDRHEGRGAEPAAAGGSAETAPNRGSFLGFVAHELRNPLSTALWSAELLARLSPEDRAGARGEKLANMSLRALQRLRLLIEDHFLAERLDVGGIPFKLEAVAVRDALEQAASKAGVEWTGTVADGLTASADRGLLERTLDALLVVASRGNAPLRVEAAGSEAGVTIRFRGAAPAPGALDTPHKGSPSDPTGRALALHMAQRVAKALGGGLTATGEEYLLTLPAAAAAASAP